MRAKIDHVAKLRQRGVVVVYRSRARWYSESRCAPERTAGLDSTGHRQGTMVAPMLKASVAEANAEADEALACD